MPQQNSRRVCRQPTISDDEAPGGLRSLAAAAACCLARGFDHQKVKILTLISRFCCAKFARYSGLESESALRCCNVAEGAQAPLGRSRNKSAPLRGWQSSPNLFEGEFEVGNQWVLVNFRRGQDRACYGVDVLRRLRKD